jgi:hypothetical protein
MIYGLVKTYYYQNSRDRDYIIILSLLHKRLVERGWDAPFIKELIIWADNAVRQNKPTDTPTDLPPPELVEELVQDYAPRRRIFFHQEFHPCDIPRRLLREIYDTRCRSTFEKIGIKTFTIAYSRPPNLQQALTRAQLHQADGRTERHFYSHVQA